MSTKSRLRPLYLASFCQGLVFWYVVDKLLATNVGLSATGIAVIITVQSIVNILCEIPSGILADRWSRRGVLMLSVVFFSIATFFGVIAAEPWHYLGIAIGWGAFYAMYSGAYEAIVYDTVMEEEGKDDNFERLFARVGVYDGIAMFIGSLGGSLLAKSFGIHTPFIATFGSILLTVYALAILKEPKLHRAHDENAHLVAHTKKTFQAVVKSPVLVGLFVISALLGGLLRIGWEFSQLWYIRLDLPLALFGVFNSLLFLSLAVRGWLVGQYKGDKFSLLIWLLLLGALATGGLMIPSPYVAAVGIGLVMLCALSAGLVLTVLEQQRLPSHIRAGATSVFSTMGHLMFIPGGLVFGWLADTYSILRAAWLMTGMLLLTAYIAYRAQRAAARQSA